MSPERLCWILLGVVTAVSAIVVWTVFNPTPHSGGDNSGYIGLAHGLLADGTYADVYDPDRLPHTKYPPVFPAVLALLMAMGARTWAALKLSAAIPTVMAVAFTYLWAERRVGALSAFAIALLLSVSSGIVHYSQWILSDPLFLALTMGALFALERADVGADTGAGATTDGVAGPAADPRADGPVTSDRLWLVAGVLLTGLAYFTRSAGLPLIVAFLAVLALRRSWTRLAGAAVALGIPMVLWWLRGRGEGVAQYGTEFWMVDPYQPALGTIGPLGLLPRILENLEAYVLRHGPAGVVGSDGPALAAIGVGLTVAGVAGWILSARREIGLTEIFFPLYAGLILVWPAVWGGDRFALPLYPLLFLYGVVALDELRTRVPQTAANAATAAVALFLILPASANWLDTTRQVEQCSRAAERAGPWACYGARIGYFVAAAAWMSEALPEGSAVLTRKPRHFYTLSGHPSRTFPFLEDPEALLGLADEVGARYVLLDRWDGLAGRYVGGAVRARPAAFCYVRGFGEPSEGGAQLLGILPSGARGPVGASGAAEVGIAPCPAGEYTSPRAGPERYSSSASIPLLSDLDS
jgi:hypothetical protein